VTIQIMRISKGKNGYTSSTNVRKAESPDERGHKNDDKIFLRDMGQTHVVLGLKVNSGPDDKPRVYGFWVKSPIDGTEVALHVMVSWSQWRAATIHIRNRGVD